NLAVIGAMPAVAAHASNMSVTANDFVNAAAGNYTLAAGSPAIAAGKAIPEVTVDRAGEARPQGTGYDVGAYEAARSGQAASEDIVVYAAKAAAVSGEWRVVADTTAAGGAVIWHPTAAANRTIWPQAVPQH